VAFPCTAWAEEHGTITNRQGFVQRYHPALSPPGQSLAGWEIISRLAKACGAAVEFASAKKVFQEMTDKVEQFKDADWGREVRPVQLRFAASRG
jgi:predicted molibdopterin-dependent oxidoreductase YjgC